MEEVVLALMLAYGGGFSDNVGVRAAAYSGNVGVSVGAAYTQYLTMTAGPEARFDVGSGDLVLRAGYAFDYSTPGDVSLGSHSALFTVAFQAPVGDDTFVEAAITPVRYPFDVNSTVGDETRDVPIEATDASFFLPGVGFGYLPFD